MKLFQELSKKINSLRIIFFRINQLTLHRLFLVGQFNLGFIVCILPEANEIYVIDQHAADEKFNFERLMRDQKIVCQHLIAYISSGKYFS